MNQTAFFLVGLLSPIFAYSHASQPPFATSTDPGGCVVEHLAVADDANFFQYDGLSPDGRLLSVGWDRGDERGMFLLNLDTGERLNIPQLNNAASFSPDGSTLIAAIYLDDGSTDIVEFDLETKTSAPVAPDPGADWLPSYSPDGETILFNSFRADHQSEVYTFEKAGGTIKRWTELPRYDAHARFSPDGETILFLSEFGPNDHDLYLIEVACRPRFVVQRGDDKRYLWKLVAERRRDRIRLGSRSGSGRTRPLYSRFENTFGAPIDQQHASGRLSVFRA